jgi:hypothetical protein
MRSGKAGQREEAGDLCSRAAATSRRSVPLRFFKVGQRGASPTESKAGALRRRSKAGTLRRRSKAGTLRLLIQTGSLGPEEAPNRS